MQRFLDEVTRVLRPGGRFFFADLRKSSQRAELADQLTATPLHLEVEEDITLNVINALVIADNEPRSRIAELFPPEMHAPLARFTLCKNTEGYERLRSEELVYLHYVLSK